MHVYLYEYRQNWNRDPRDLFCRKFLESGKRMHSMGGMPMNLAPIHSLCLLYEITGRARYLAMAREICLGMATIAFSSLRSDTRPATSTSRGFWVSRPTSRRATGPFA